MRKFIKLFFISLIFMGVLLFPSFAESGHPNAPVLLENMTPIKWNSGSEPVRTDATDLDWYRYEKNKWANVIDEVGNYWVWIPRYTYKIEGNEVLIKWSVGTTDYTSDGYRVHPAFVSEAYLGGDSNNSNNYKYYLDSNQLTGFWVAKYVASEVDDKVVIQPNRNPDKSKNIGDAFDACNNIRKGLSVSTHLIKASEWGAVSYLTRAFGSNPSKNSSGITGGNNKSFSTTNNYYGVFDMNGPVDEYLSAFVVKDALSEENLKYAGKMVDKEYERFVDVISLATDDNSTNNEARLENFYGFSMSELETNNTKSVPTGSEPFFTKGGINTGLFGYGKSSGANGLAYRPTMSIYTTYLSEDMIFFDTEAVVQAGDYLIVSVNFSVDEDWKFDLDSGEKIIENGNVVSGKETRLFKFIDLRYVQDNDTISFTNGTLNEQLISIIEDKNKVLNLDDNTVFRANTKYTIRVRLGGEIDGDPVFQAIPGMNAKIVVDNIEVKSASNGEKLRVSKIPNNKVRLRITGPNGRYPVLTGVKLWSAPSKVNYYLGEELSLVGGKLEISYGNNKAYVDLTKDNVPNFDTITDQPGSKFVELWYPNTEGDKVIQDDPKFIIDVSPDGLYEVFGKSNPINTASIFGAGKYGEGSIVTLSVAEYPGFKFKNWSSDDVSIKNSNSITGATFSMPKKDVTVVANMVGVLALDIVDVQTEFEQGDEFGLGNGKIVARYPDGSEEYLNLDSDGVTSNPSKGEILDTLGVKNVVIEYGGAELNYEINVIKNKYNFIVQIDSEEYGAIKVNGNVVVPVNGEIRATLSISYDEIVSIEAVPREGYAFYSWYVSEDNVLDNESNVLSQDALFEPTISFFMPQSSIIITGNFVKAHTVKYLVNDDAFGYIDKPSDVTQVIRNGESGVGVTAVAYDGYKFSKWDDGRESATRVDQYVTADATYTAYFAKTYKVTFLVDGNVFAERVVEYGEDGYISRVPVKREYIFDKWDQDLTCITEDITTNAMFIPVISITPNGNTIPSNFVTALIEGKGIQSGTLEYIISDSPTDPGEDVSNYTTDGRFEFPDREYAGRWTVDSNNPELFRSYIGLNAKEDSSTTITINSTKDKELVRFDYMFSVTSGQLLGITVNGTRVTNGDEEVDVWHSFNNEVATINGKIIIGISYSQDLDYDPMDFAAIKNLRTGRSWIPIENEYNLNDNALWEDNYVYIRGKVLDDIRYSELNVDLYPDNGMYMIRSDVFKGILSDTYNITYDLSCSHCNANGTVTGNPTRYSVTDEFTLNRPTLSGHTFAGWMGTGLSSPTMDVTIKQGSFGDRSYKATYLVDQPASEYYTIKFNANGGSGSMTSQMVNVGSSVKLSSNTFSYGGKSFKEWNTKANGSGTRYQNGATITPTGDMELYAQWNNKLYTVTWINWDGTELEVDEGVAYETSPTYNGATPTKDADEQYKYTWAGWEPEVVKVTRDATYKATFSEAENGYIITFNANGGSGTMTEQRVTSSTKTQIKANNFDAPEGYSFAGWNTKPDRSGDSYENGDDIILTGDVTLYAQWYCSGVCNYCGGDGLDPSWFDECGTREIFDKEIDIVWEDGDWYYGHKQDPSGGLRYLCGFSKIVEYDCSTCGTTDYFTGRPTGPASSYYGYCPTCDVWVDCGSGYHEGGSVWSKNSLTNTYYHAIRADCRICKGEKHCSHTENESHYYN